MGTQTPTPRLVLPSRCYGMPVALSEPAAISPWTCTPPLHLGGPVPDHNVIARATDQGIVADGANPGGHRLVARDVVVAPQGKVLVATSLRSTRICMRCPRGVPMPSTPHQTAMLGLSPGRVYGMIATARKRLPASRVACRRRILCTLGDVLRRP
jgi:hypothetical protein